MNKKTGYILILLLLVTGAWHHAVSQIVMKSYVIGSGATASLGGGSVMVGTVGQTIIGRVNGGTLNNSQGFWYTALPGGTTAVHEETGGASLGSLQLTQNIPNPFSTSTQFKMSIPTSGQVSLVLYDGLGRVVETLIDGHREAGTSTFTLTSDGLSSGRYTVALVFGSERKSIVVNVVK